MQRTNTAAKRICTTRGQERWGQPPPLKSCFFGNEYSPTIEFKKENRQAD